MDPSGRASRRMADPSIRVSYLDASKLQLYFDEQEDGLVDLIVREPAGPVRVIGSVPVGQRIMDVVDRIDFRVAERTPTRKFSSTPSRCRRRVVSGS